MKLEFKASFARDLKHIKDQAIFRRVQEVIKEIDMAANTLEIKNLKKLKGEGKYYSIRLGDYRLGLTIPGPSHALLPGDFSKRVHLPIIEYFMPQDSLVYDMRRRPSRFIILVRSRLFGRPFSITC